MKNLEPGSSWKKIMESKPMLIFLGLVALFFAWNVIGLFGRMEETIRNREAAAVKVADLEAQKANLSGDINNLETTEGKEKIFRENYGLAKPGEDLTVIVDDQTKPEAVSKGGGGLFSFFKNWFK